MANISLRISPLFLSLSLLVACSDDASTTGTGTGSESETGASTDTESGSAGDGDGDPAGDGDGDSAGDGDGDGVGDGDGDVGDGDGDVGDGDGDVGDGDGDPVDEGLSCGVIVQCTQDCGNDLDCQDACVMMGSQGGQGEYDGLLQCIIDNNCNNQNCIENNCGPELFACYTGDATCSELAGCSSMCNGDPVCEASCYYNGSGLGQAQLEDFGGCIEANNCGGDQACIDENCGAEQAGCLGGGADTLPCPIVTDCLFSCEGDAQCELGCGPVTDDVQAEADAVVACGEINDCQSLDCIENPCPDEFFACIEGEGTCFDLFTCFAGCVGNELCEYNCITDANLMAQFVASALYDCADDNNCAPDDVECIVVACGAESMACGI